MVVGLSLMISTLDAHDPFLKIVECEYDTMYVRNPNLEPGIAGATRKHLSS